MTIGVLKYPGGHGDAELIHVLKHYFGRDVRELWYREKGFEDLGTLFIGGGFPLLNISSFEGLLTESPALNYLKEFVARGKRIVAFGNGFQLLCEAGLLPGSIQKNTSGRFINKQVFIKPENHSNLLTSGLKNTEVLRIPIATEFGRYDADEEVLMKMRQEGQILFRYCDHEGRITEAINYTGSRDNIAGVCNASKNVFGMIPQPERAVKEFLNDADGMTILRSFLQQARN